MIHRSPKKKRLLQGAKRNWNRVMEERQLSVDEFALSRHQAVWSLHAKRSLQVHENYSNMPRRKTIWTIR